MFNSEKAERLMEIMLEEDKERYEKGEELVYHTKEDFDFFNQKNKD